MQKGHKFSENVEMILRYASFALRIALCAMRFLDCQMCRPDPEAVIHVITARCFTHRAFKREVTMERKNYIGQGFSFSAYQLAGL
jgi:hypothetical protein